MPPAADLRQLLEGAVAQHRSGALDDAAAGYRKVLAAAPRNADALHLLGLVLHQQGDTTNALTLIEQARDASPRNPDIIYNLGRICLALQDWPMAAEANRAALALNPAMGAAACNLGLALVRLGQAAEGEAAIRNGLANGADNAASLSALGLALHHQAQDTEAEAAWTEALARDPAFAEARFNLGAARLRRRDFAGGWPLFAVREQAEPASFASGGPMPVHIPRWRGETLADRCVLLWGEQGLGDQILFASLIPDLAPKRIVLACAPRLVALLTRAFPRITIIPQDASLPTALAQLRPDIQLPLGDLGGLCRPSPTSFSEPEPFLCADPARVAALKERYRAWAGGNRLVGISWHSQRASFGAHKSLPLPQWAPVLNTPGVAFVSLQYGATEADLAGAAREGHAIHVDPAIDPTHDLEGLAAQIAAMDLVISVSNTTVHLAGGLGVPTWTMAPLGGGGLWYWFTPRAPWQPSAWYAGMRLYHQSTPGRWDEMLHRIKIDLDVFCAIGSGA